LTRQPDYALRVLIHVGLRDGERVRFADLLKSRHRLRRLLDIDVYVKVS
jgi:hypothetical protein